MPLKKPSELFNKKKSVSVVEEIIEKEVEINTFSEAFEQFKLNLKSIDALSTFSESLENYTENIQKINIVSEYINDIKEELKLYITREDLERSSLAQLLVVEKCIETIEEKIEAINQDYIDQIKSNTEEISNKVDSFLNFEAPKYKKLVVESELRTGERFDRLKVKVNDSLENISNLVDIRYTEILENVDTVNQTAIDQILDQFNKLQEEIPNYRNFIVESELKNEERILNFQEILSKTAQTINNKLDSIEGANGQIIEELREEIQSLVKDTSFQKLVVESELRTEERFNALKLNVNKVLENIDNLVDVKYTEILDAVDNSNKSAINEILDEFNKLQQEIPNYRNFIIESRLKNEEGILNFQEILSKTLDIVNGKVDSIEGVNEQITEELQEKIQLVSNLIEDAALCIKEIESHKIQINEKVTELESQITVNESHINKQNKHIDSIQEEVYSTLQKLNLDVVDEKNKELSRKIKYLEEIFEKFNEKQILSENTLAEPPTIINKDPLTPLDQNYVTLEQLQQHYRLFVNRVQQQLATIGGGGETRLKYLDDIVGIATNPSDYDGKILSYNHSIGKFEFITNGSVEPSSGIATFATIAGYAATAGIATFATTAGFASSSAGIATFATTAGYAATAGIATFATNAGYARTAGISTFATTAGIATFATTAGYAATAGIATFATTAGYAVTAGIATYSSSAGIATFATTAGYARTAGISTFAISAGYATSTGISTFATFATTAGTANTATTANFAISAETSTSVVGGIASVNSLTVSGVTTLGIVTATTYYGKIKEDIKIINSDYNVTPKDSVLIASGNITIFMPNALGNSGDKYYIKNVGIETVTILPQMGELIDNYSEMTLNQKNSSLILISSNSTWLIF
ncbi:tail fiber protein [Synechococcus phage B3]|nr:tail fiber protein [Synechococcus phage B3]QGT54886.1 tail fiber protein [Synechococcus phage B23]